MAKVPPHRANLALARWVYSFAESRMVMGAPKYGDYNPETDSRNMGRECIEEYGDAFNYLGMGELKRQDLARFIQKMRAKTILLIGMARQLEEMMQTPAKDPE